MSLITLLLRIGAAIIGVLLLGCSVFLYEDEEGKIQSTLLELWTWTDDAGRTALSAQGAVIRAIATSTDGFLNRLFGPTILSWHAATVAICFSLATTEFLNCFPPSFPRSSELFGGTECTYSFVFYLTAAVAPILWTRLRMAPAIAVGCAVAPLLLFSGAFPESFVDFVYAPFVLLTPAVPYAVLYDVFGEEPTTLGYAIVVAMTLASSVAADFFLLSATRYLIRRCAEVSRLWPILTMMITGLAVPLIAVVVPLRLALAVSQYSSPRIETATGAMWQVFEFTGWSDLYLSVVVIVFLAIASGMAVHLLLWAAIQRPLYAAQRFGLIGRHKVLAAAGVLFVSMAFPAFGRQVDKIVALFK